MQNRFSPFRSPCKNEAIQFSSLKLCQTLRHVLLQFSKGQYTSVLFVSSLVTVFVPAVATKPAELPSQLQRRKIVSVDDVSRRLPGKTLPLAVRTSASLSQTLRFGSAMLTT
jgi:hypothetical protein